MKSYISTKQLLGPFNISTPIGDSSLAQRVCHDCTILVNHKDTIASLVELEKLEFDIIIGMDLLHVFYARINCRTQVSSFNFLMSL